jgi:cytidylate kinase
LRVRAVAPFEIRARRIAAREGIALKDAERKVRAADASRAAFIRKVYHRDIDDPLGYDLMVNTEALGAEHAAEAVHAALVNKLGGIR